MPGAGALPSAPSQNKGIGRRSKTPNIPSLACSFLEERVSHPPHRLKLENRSPE